MSSVPRKKAVLARAMAASRLTRVVELAHQLVTPRAHVRAVNYHGTPHRFADSFDRQLAYYRERFDPVTPRDLDLLLSGKPWERERPGLIISFDDGLRSNYDVARPALEKHGFVGWFFIPAALVSGDEAVTADAAREAGIVPDEAYDDGRLTMNWDEVRDLVQRHVVGCHTGTHCWLRAGLDDAQVHREVVTPKATLERALNRTIDVFCWVGGEEWAYSAAGARAVAAAGYRFSFMTNNAVITRDTPRLQLQRTNIEADWPLDVVRFQLSGAMDLLYLGKRRLVNRLTAQ